MRRTVVGLLAFGLTACAGALGSGPGEVPLSTVGLRVDAGTTAEAAAGALMEVRADYALIVAPMDAAWLASVADLTGLHLSGPARSGDLSLAFLGEEPPLGDTAIVLTYRGGTLTLQDALYELGEDHYLDLMSFEVERMEDLEPLVTRLLEYVATDVDPTAALVMAVAVPGEAVGDSLTRLLGPGNFDAFRCADGDWSTTVARGIRLYYGPERRVRCADADAAQVPAGLRVHADLIAGWQ